MPYLLGLFNWDNDRSLCVWAGEAMGIAFPASGEVPEVWSNENARVKNGALTVPLAPHQSRLFVWEK